MSFEISTLRDQKVMWCTFKGGVDAGVMEQAAQARWNYGDGKVFAGLLVLVNDYSNATLKIGKEALLRSVEIADEAARSNPNLTLIGILPKDFDFGLGRMFEGYAVSSPWKSMMVRTREECQQAIDDCLRKAGHS